MRKSLFLYAVLVILSLLSVGHFSEGRKEQRNQEKTTGIKIVVNDKGPAFGQVTYELEEDLVLGAEKEAEDQFNRIWSFQVDARENIYVSDIKDRRIKMFGREGKYVRDFGRLGQGPGEFQGVRDVAIEERSGDVYSMDYMKFLRFNRDGRYQNSIQVDRMVEKYFVDSDGAIWALTFYIDETRQGHAFEKISPDGKVIKRIREYTGISLIQTRTGEDTVTVVGSPTEEYEPKLLIARIDDKTYLSAVSGEYELDVVDSNGDPLLKIKKKETRPSFSTEEKDAILNRFRKEIRGKIKLPKNKPFFKKIFADDEGRLYLQNFPDVASVKSVKEEYIFDVFSRNGNYLFRINIPMNPSVIKNRCLYALVIDPNTKLEMIKRYKIKNWDRIPKDIS